MVEMREYCQAAFARQKIRFGVDHIAWLSTDIDAFFAHVGQTRSGALG